MNNWNENYILNISSIDTQHKIWLELMGKLRAVAVEEQKPQKIMECLNEMENYASFHFQYEENLFRELGFKEEAGHCELHRQFEKNVCKLRSELNRGYAPMVATLLKEMQDWLVGHICGEDKKYAELFRAKGIC